MVVGKTRRLLPTTRKVRVVLAMMNLLSFTVLLNIATCTAKHPYQNKLLSDHEWVWKGNVVLAHESGTVSGEIVEWVSTNSYRLEVWGVGP
jgi:hypothetical protein